MTKPFGGCGYRFDCDLRYRQVRFYGFVAVGRTVFGGGYQHAGFGCGAADFGGIGFDPRQSGAKQHDVRHGVPDYDCLHDLRFRVFEIPVPREHHG